VKNNAPTCNCSIEWLGSFCQAPFYTPPPYDNYSIPYDTNINLPNYSLPNVPQESAYYPTITIGNYTGPRQNVASDSGLIAGLSLKAVIGVCAAVGIALILCVGLCVVSSVYTKKQKRRMQMQMMNVPSYPGAGPVMVNRNHSPVSTYSVNYVDDEAENINLTAN